MKNINLKSLSTKDKMLIAKAIADISTDIYKSQNEFILNQIIKNGKYISEFGQFYKSETTAKTVAEVLSKKQESLIKLQNEIAELEKLDKSMLYTENKIILNSKHTDVANNIAKELLQDIYVSIDSKRLNKASKR